MSGDDDTLVREIDSLLAEARGESIEAEQIA